MNKKVDLVFIGLLILTSGIGGFLIGYWGF